MTAKLCEICGEPMPDGETMFKFHGYSGPCPKPPLKKQTPAPAWHDAPTCAGLWLCNYGILEVVCVNQPDVDNFDDFYNAGGRWYGPIPQDGE